MDVEFAKARAACQTGAVAALVHHPFKHGSAKFRKLCYCRYNS